jgi:hypothetical protein
VSPSTNPASNSHKKRTIAFISDDDDNDEDDEDQSERRMSFESKLYILTNFPSPLLAAKKKCAVASSSKGKRTMDVRGVDRRVVEHTPAKGKCFNLLISSF